MESWWLETPLGKLACSEGWPSRSSPILGQNQSDVSYRVLGLCDGPSGAGWGGVPGWLQEGEQKATGDICDGHLVLEGSNGIWEPGSCVCGFAYLFTLLAK